MSIESKNFTPASPTTTNVSERFLAWLSVVVSVPAGRWKVKPYN
jgi:hypothetical protein